MAECITRSTLVYSTQSPIVSADIVNYWFTAKSTATSYECFDYSPDYDYCKKRLATEDPTTYGYTLLENFWTHKETRDYIYCSAYKDGNNDV